MTPELAMEEVVADQAGVQEIAEDPASPVETSPTEAAVETESNPCEPSRKDRFAQLPGYSRSLLRIEVPVSVRLASKKESIQEIIELAPGSIIKFNKACEQPLHLYVGDQEVAEGEAVKVGDYFGFRLSQMLMPQEHFCPVRRPDAG
jgi:flagellar motor switch/type III secretory pathway protein FliN